MDVCGGYTHILVKKLLSRIRWGQCTPDVLEELRSCSERRFGGGDGIEETQLMTHKADVFRENEKVRTSVLKKGLKKKLPLHFQSVVANDPLAGVGREMRSQSCSAS